jgi:fatty acid desaturase
VIYTDETPVQYRNVLPEAVMNEVFDRESVLDAAIQSELMTRSDHISGLRLAIHLSCIALSVWAAVLLTGTLWIWLAIIVLAFFIGTVFAPFHECCHGTAFSTPMFNRYGAALTGVLFGVSWRAYREFHFQHHSDTQDPKQDPEIMMDPKNLSPWPRSVWRWLITLSGGPLLFSKLTGLGACWIPGGTTRFATLPKAARIETQVISMFWWCVMLAALFELPGAMPLLAGFILGHIVEGLWLTAEHSGCAEGGSILARTRSVKSNALVRFFLWNMNYHSEHHGWPGVPWHALPALHQRIGDRVDIQPGYFRLYRGVLSAQRD